MRLLRGWDIKMLSAVVCLLGLLGRHWLDHLGGGQILPPLDDEHQLDGERLHRLVDLRSLLADDDLHGGLGVLVSRGHRHSVRPQRRGDPLRLLLRRLPVLPDLDGPLFLWHFDLDGADCGREGL
jgi:hypothetical protein